MVFTYPLYANDIYNSLSEKDISYKNFIDIFKDKECNFSLQMLEPSVKPLVSFISNENIKTNKVTAWWEIKKLPEVFNGSTFQKRISISGIELETFIIDYPSLQNDWFYSFNNSKNLLSKLVSMTAFPLPINNEIHIYLSFEVQSKSKLSSGVLSNKKLPNFSKHKFKEETSLEKINIVTQFIKENNFSANDIVKSISVYSIGANSLLVQWYSDLKNRFNRPNGIILSVKEKQLFAYNKVPVISDYDDHREYSESLYYLASYDLDGDNLPEIQHRYWGRYHSSDSVLSFTEEGAILCDYMILGSD